MWLTQTTLPERRALVAAFAGYGVDGFDTMIYTFIIPTLLAVWGMSKAEAGYIATGTLLTSALGGWAAGVLADRFGRVRILQLTIAWFALFTFLSGFTDSFLQLLIVRSLQGLGFGGEWAVGSILIAETIRPANRGRATGLVQSSWAVGWAGAACVYWGAYALMPPQHAWRVMLWSGVLPGLLVVYIRRNVAEPAIYLQARAHANPMAAQFLSIFNGPLLRITVLASLLSGGMLGAYYSVTTWLPTFLNSERHLSVTGTATYLLVLIAGCFAGYLSSAWLSDAIGRRRCFVLFALGGILAVLAYTHIRAGDLATEVLGFPLGFFNSGIFAGTGAYLTELYPTAVRGSGQGFSYSFGRALGAVCPALIGRATTEYSLGEAIGAMTAVAYLVVILAVWALPETRGRVLTVEAPAVG
ncbi:MAG TPA: MFS transporter [Steroidobacteraceae bacterium]|nr:MFS transporter [Steroidobacteraceae bacterium]